MPSVIIIMTVKPVWCFCAVYHALYLEELTAAELIRKMACVCSIPLGTINQVYRQGPTGIHILLSDQVHTHTHSLSLYFECHIHGPERLMKWKSLIKKQWNKW